MMHERERGGSALWAPLAAAAVARYTSWKQQKEMIRKMTTQRRVELLHVFQIVDELVRRQLVNVWFDVMNDDDFLESCEEEFQRKDSAEHIFCEFTTHQTVSDTHTGFYSSSGCNTDPMSR
jgi:acid phosphatase class B